MTVIAYDHKRKTLSVDSLFVSGERKSYGSKFRVLDDGRVIVFAGDAKEGRKAAMAIEAGLAPTLAAIASCTIVVLYTKGRQKGQVLMYDDNPEYERVTKTDAWGTGSDFAMGALDAGATSEEAVKIACKRSASCGGKVHTFTWE